MYICMMSVLVTPKRSENFLNVQKNLKDVLKMMCFEKVSDAPLKALVNIVVDR